MKAMNKVDEKWISLYYRTFSGKADIYSLAFIPLSILFLVCSALAFALAAISLACNLLTLFQSKNLLKAYLGSLKVGVNFASNGVITFLLAPFALIAYPYSKLMNYFQNKKKTSSYEHGSSSTAGILANTTKVGNKYEETDDVFSRPMSPFAASYYSDSSLRTFSQSKKPTPATNTSTTKLGLIVA